MKIAFSLEADTASELLQQLKDFVHEEGVGNKPKTPTKEKPETPADEDDAPPVKKKTPTKKTEAPAEDEVSLEDADFRQKFKDNEWPVEQSKAFMLKNGFTSITNIPAKKRAEFMELLTEAGSWSAKKLSTYLEPEDL